MRQINFWNVVYIITVSSVVTWKPPPWRHSAATNGVWDFYSDRRSNVRFSQDKKNNRKSTPDFFFFNFFHFLCLVLGSILRFCQLKFFIKNCLWTVIEFSTKRFISSILIPYIRQIRKLGREGTNDYSSSLPISKMQAMNTNYSLLKGTTLNISPSSLTRYS